SPARAGSPTTCGPTGAWTCPPACGRTSPAPVLDAAVEDVRAGARPERVATRFHTAVAGLVRRVCGLARERTGLSTVALTGGVFVNTLLAEAAARTLREDGFTVLRHRLVPPNDGGLALGQLLVAARRRGA
ncbi:hypothetical protein ABT168_35865, partial [Streptomyces sp. NPDC001793]